MNIKKIQELIELMNANDLTEIDIEHEGTRIRLTKRPHGVVEQQVEYAPAGSPARGAPPKEAAEKETRNLLEVKSPMVGTFYRAPGPDADPYVKRGDTVRKGDILCIIEAMKLMNEVKSEFSGRIVDILTENAEPVEFGQIMILIEPV